MRPQVTAAWADAYTTVAGVMIEGAGNAADIPEPEKTQEALINSHGMGIRGEGC